MYLRLAFSVAAHLEPEILFVDEVLAVGDAAFQKKCINKMQEVGEEGRTVLFVTHDMSAITRLCQRTVLLHEGYVSSDGPSHRVVAVYLQSEVGTKAARVWPEVAKAPGNDIVRLRSVRVCTEDGETTEAVGISRPVGIEVQFDVLTPDHVLVPNLHFFNAQGTCIFMLNDLEPTWHRRCRPVGRFLSTAWIPGNFLSEGRVAVRVAISTYVPFNVYLDERDAVAFEIIDNLDGDTARGDYAGPMPGVVRPLLSWTTKFTPRPPRKCGNS